MSPYLGDEPESRLRCWPAFGTLTLDPQQWDRAARFSAVLLDQLHFFHLKLLAKRKSTLIADTMLLCGVSVPCDVEVHAVLVFLMCSPPQAACQALNHRLFPAVAQSRCA